jgi:hypothetical protein
MKEEGRERRWGKRKGVKGERERLEYIMPCVYANNQHK